MKKKLFTILFTAVLTLTVSTATAFAGGHGCRANYTDANQDGICDYYSQNSRCASNCQGDTCHVFDQDGVCQSCGLERPCVDENQDGICDYHASRYPAQNADGSGYRRAGSVCRSGHHQQNNRNSSVRQAGHHGGRHC